MKRLTGLIVMGIFALGIGSTYFYESYVKSNIDVTLEQNYEQIKNDSIIIAHAYAAIDMHDQIDSLEYIVRLNTTDKPDLQAEIDKLLKELENARNSNVSRDLIIIPTEDPKIEILERKVDSLINVIQQSSSAYNSLSKNLGALEKQYEVALLAKKMAEDHAKYAKYQAMNAVEEAEQARLVAIETYEQLTILQDSVSNMEQPNSNLDSLAWKYAKYDKNFDLEAYEQSLYRSDSIQVDSVVIDVIEEPIIEEEIIEDKKKKKKKKRKN